ncbi:hypothetical protein NL475_27210, partial [Klebsiella pneumoniae]|nr:hypothetical protein [Klebsiella pneumoniae]
KPVALVLSRVPPQGRLRDEVAAAIAERDLPLLPVRLGNRSGFAVSFARGLGAVEDEPRGKAAAEALALAGIVRAE